MNSNEEPIKLSDEQFVEIVGKIASSFHKVISMENTITITDKEKLTHYFKGQESPNIELIGKPYPKAGNIITALKTGTQQSSIIPKEVYGEECKSSTIPFMNNTGDIIGTINVALSLKNQKCLTSSY